MPCRTLEKAKGCLNGLEKWQMLINTDFGWFEYAKIKINEKISQQAKKYWKFQRT